MVEKMIEKAYKATDVGQIPNDWELKKIKDTCKIYNGGTPKTTVKEYWNGEIFWCTPTDITHTSGKYLFETERKITNKGLENSSATLLPEGSLLLCTRATIGDVKIAKVKAATNQGFKSLVCLRETDNEFLYYKILTMKKKFIEKAIGTTFLEISKKDVEELLFSIPSDKREQVAISEILSDMDCLIESISGLIEKKKCIKQGAMQELLTGKKQLPQFDKQANDISKRYKQSEFGEIPEDWRLVQLKDIVITSRSIRYGIVQPGDFDPNGRYMIRGQDYSEAKGWAKPTDVFKVSNKIENRYKNARVKTGDIIMTIVGYCGHVDIIPKWLDGSNLTQTTARISVDGSKASNRFCKYQLQSSFGQAQVSMYLKGAAQPGLNIYDVKNFVVALPSMEEQIAIAQVLLDMDSEIEALERKRDKYRLLKVGLMQQLLTGRIRLKCLS